jgi:hypothetical protein
MEGGMLEVLVYAALLPVALLMDVWALLKRARSTPDPRANELAIASHGAGFLALAALAVWIAGPSQTLAFMLAAPAAFPDDWMHWLPALALAVAVGGGLLSLMTGARRSLAWAGFRDARLLSRAVVKIGMAATVWWVFWYAPSSGHASWLAWLAVARLLPWSRACIVAVIVWLVVTGSTKFLLVIWPRFASAIERVIQNIKEHEWNWDA